MQLLLQSLSYNYGNHLRNSPVILLCHFLYFFSFLLGHNSLKPCRILTYHSTSLILTFRDLYINLSGKVYIFTQVPHYHSPMVSKFSHNPVRVFGKEELYNERTINTAKTEIEQRNEIRICLRGFRRPLRIRGWTAGGSSMKQDIIFDVESDGLNPLQNRLTAVGVKTSKWEYVIMEDDEAKLLDRFWKFLGKFEYFRLIGFNNFQFDNYFLNIRSFKHNVKIIDCRNNLLDLRNVLAFGGKFKNGKLEDYAGLLGEQKYAGLTGELVVDAWKNKKLAIIEKYLRQDLRMTFKIYERCKEIGLL